MLLGLVLALASIACGSAQPAPPTVVAPSPTIAAPSPSPAAQQATGTASPSPATQQASPSPAGQQAVGTASPSPAARQGMATASPPPATQQASPPPAAQGYPLRLTDDLGRTVTLAAQPQRIATLQPSATEIVCAIDACARVVATDDFSDFPPEVVPKPKLGAMGMSAEGIISYQPELVVTDAGTRPELIEQVSRAGIPVLVTDATNFDDVLRTIELIGQAVGSTDAAARVTQGMRMRVQAVRAKTDVVQNRPRVMHELDATDPNRPFVVGPRTFIDELITLAGGANALGNSPVAYPQVSTEQVIAADPEIITLGDAAFGVSTADVAARPGWSGVTAVKNGAIHAVDTNLVSRPGPRLVEALEEFAAIIHPELFP